ncbi:MAG: hypothetical protein ABII23_07945, partial [bacterium]
MICFFNLALFSTSKYIKWRGFGHPEHVEETVEHAGKVKQEYIKNDQFTLEFQGRKPGGTYVICSVFVLITIIFIPMGIVLAEHVKIFPPLQAYTINIIGSLTGVLCFTIFSFLRAPPLVWFFVGFMLLLVFLMNQKKMLLFGFVIMIITMVPFLFIDKNASW